jgi:hypothetical protein
MSSDLHSEKVQNQTAVELLPEREHYYLPEPPPDALVLPDAVMYQTANCYWLEWQGSPQGHSQA